MHFDLQRLCVVNATHISPTVPKQHYNIRWDKGNITEYYNRSRDYLYTIKYNHLHSQCAEFCSSANHRAAIDQHYSCIVNALKSAERETIPRVPCGSLKPFWNEHLNDLKQKSILWHSIWVSSNRPTSGLIFRIKSSSKLNYKLAIKNAFTEYESRFNDDLLNHYVKKYS